VTVLIASDLDRTLIYSRAARALAGEPTGPLRCVETRDGVAVSHLTDAAAGLLQALPPWAHLVAFTTRTPEQLARVRLPGRPARFAVAANGGRLLVDGVPDAEWSARVARELADACSLAQVQAELELRCHPDWTLAVRGAAGLFCYAVLDRERTPRGFVADVDEWLVARGWTSSLQGRKLYAVPSPLTKSAALAEVARRLDASLVLGAGDSLLDVDLLAACDLGIHPGHGEIAASGWSAEHVHSTGSFGAQAGEDICRWFHETAIMAR
jgi:hypothetical protein